MPDRVRTDDLTITAEQLIALRAENRSKRAKIDKFLKDYGRIILAVAIFISSWFMGNVVRPLQQIPSLVRTTDSLSKRQLLEDVKYDSIISRLNEAHQDRTRMVDILAALAGLQCDQFSARERRTSKLCGKLLNGELP